MEGVLEDWQDILSSYLDLPDGREWALLSTPGAGGKRKADSNTGNSQNGGSVEKKQKRHNPSFAEVSLECQHGQTPLADSTRTVSLLNDNTVTNFITSNRTQVRVPTQKCQMLQLEEANQDKSGQVVHIPLSLFDSCVYFIAENIHLVESFVGFPDDVGKKIFSRCEKKKVFDDLNGKSLDSMVLFTEAYCDTILSSLNLTNSHRILGLHMEHFVIFQHLSEVDLTSCKLGDDHDILSFLATLTCLKCLGLADNALSDDGIQRLTAPIRMFGKETHPLRYLVLAGNGGIPDTSSHFARSKLLSPAFSNQPMIGGVTKRAVRFLKCFKNLKHLDISATRITVADLPMLYDTLNLTTAKTSSTEFPLCKTEGWATDVVERWKIHSPEVRGPKSVTNSRVSGFYGRKKPLAPESTITKAKEFTPKLILVKDNSIRSPPGCKEDVKPKQDSTGKKFGSMVSYKKPKSTPDDPKFVQQMRMKWLSSKQQTENDIDSGDDSDLLSIYKTNSEDNQRKKTLLEAMGDW